jgi:small subunit ribosomal protein MRP21
MVKRLFYKERNHERQGMKRKRLKMERWQRRFRTGFNAAAKRVVELKGQGW